MEQYCKYDTSILLKEKGFNELCEANYFGPDSTSVQIGLPTYNKYYVNGRCCAPSLDQAAKWLRERHSIYFESSCAFDDTISRRVVYSFHIYEIHDTFVWKYDTEYLSYEEAYESAIKYSLEHLI